MHTLTRLLASLTLALAACSPADFGAGARVAEIVISGAACGVAAANGTPCTPREVLDALARDAAAQRAKVEAVAPAAAAVDPEATKKILEELAANTESNRRLAEAIVSLASRATPAPTATTSAAPETP